MKYCHLVTNTANFILILLTRPWLEEVQARSYSRPVESLESAERLLWASSAQNTVSAWPPLKLPPANEFFRRISCVWDTVGGCRLDGLEHSRGWATAVSHFKNSHSILCILKWQERSVPCVGKGPKNPFNIIVNPQGWQTVPLVHAIFTQCPPERTAKTEWLCPSCTNGDYGD